MMNKGINKWTTERINEGNNKIINERMNAM